MTFIDTYGNEVAKEVVETNSCFGCFYYERFADYNCNDADVPSCFDTQFKVVQEKAI